MAEDGLDRIIHGDTFEVLPTLPRDSVDLVFADPPYNLQLAQDLWRPNMTRVDAVDDAWDRFDSFAAYDDFTRGWLSLVREAMKPSATIWISGTYHNIFRVGAILQDLGFWILNTVAWYKPNAMPNFRGTRLKNDVEFVVWAKRDKTGRYTFNHHEMKLFNGGKQLGSMWEIPVCGGAERLKDSDGKKLHPTQKPEDLLLRIIAASTQCGDVVLDPFLGSGTTAAAAKMLHRHWIGIERDPVYVEAARQRVSAVQPYSADHPLVRGVSRQKRVRRVSFKELVSRGLLQPGQQLVLDRSEHTATILPDGRIHSDGITGSIHTVGAHLKQAPSCNGWTHWRYQDARTGELVLIDDLRDAVHRSSDPVPPTDCSQEE